MNTPQAVTNATARLTMDSVDRLIEKEVEFATQRMRGQEQALRRQIADLQSGAAIDDNLRRYRETRVGKMMAVMAIGSGIVGVLFGYFVRGVLMK